MFLLLIFPWRLAMPELDEQDKSHTFFLSFNQLTSETYKRIVYIPMKKEVMYEVPQVEVIEVEVEKGFAASNGEGDGDVTGEGMGGLN